MNSVCSVGFCLLPRLYNGLNVWLLFMTIFVHLLFTCMMNLSCPGPPSAPYDLTLPLVGLSAAHLNWTAPEDDGGISDRSWDPAIDGEQNTTTLTYTVTLTNGKDTTMVMTNVLSLIVSNLQHSTAYTVTVVAENVYERGPKAANFTKPSINVHRCQQCLVDLQI